MLRIDSNIIWTIVNLIILYLLLRKFLFKRILGIMEQRKNQINNQYAQAQEAEDKANALKTQYEESLAGAKEEAKQLVEDARGRGEADYARMIQEARDTSSQMLAKTREDIDRAHEQALADIRSEIGSLAVSAAEKILGSGSNPETDEALMDEFLKKAGTDYDDTDGQ